MMTLYARYTTQDVKPLPALQAAWLFEKSSSWNVGVTDKKKKKLDYNRIIIRLGCSFGIQILDSSI